MEIRIDLAEGLLGDFCRVSRIPRHKTGNSEHTILVSLKQEPLRFRILPPAAIENRVVLVDLDRPRVYLEYLVLNAWI